MSADGAPERETAQPAGPLPRKALRAAGLTLREHKIAAGIGAVFAAAIVVGSTYPIGADPGATVASKYGVVALPQTFFLNAQHRIVDRVFGAVTRADLAAGVRLMGASGS